MREEIVEHMGHVNGMSHLWVHEKKLILFSYFLQAISQQIFASFVSY